MSKAIVIEAVSSSSPFPFSAGRLGKMRYFYYLDARYCRDGKKVGARLRDPASWLPLAAGASSHSLGPTFFTFSVNIQSPLGLAKVCPGF